MKPASGDIAAVIMNHPKRSKTLNVLVNEVVVTVTRRSFLLVAVGVPMVSFMILLGVSALNRNAPDTLNVLMSTPVGVIKEGFVDEAGLIDSIPASLPADALAEFPTREAAHLALARGEIAAFYVIPSDFLARGEVINVRPDFNPFSAFEQGNQIEWLLQVNLLDGEETLAARVTNPIIVEEVSLSPQQQRDDDNPLTFFVPYTVTLIFYTVILMSASFLLSSLTKEKENRVLEILLVSISPRQMLTGKIVGLGLVGLLQTALWSGTGFVVLQITGRSVNLPAGLQLPVSILLWGAVYFLMGYALYASLMASLGALVPSMREASQATFLIILPMIVPLMMISVLIEDPSGPLATGLSLFPLTAPVTMMTRLAAGQVPAWQLLLSMTLMAITTLLVFRAVIRMFQAQILLSGQPFNLKRLVNTWIGKF